MLLWPLRHKVLRGKSVGAVADYCTSICNKVKDAEPIFHLPEENTKILKVGIIGVPNAGKSTFINSLMERKVCPTSSKVHTTRGKTMAIFTEGDAQIVFLDTPGLVNEKEKQRYNLEKTFHRDTKNALKEADIIGVIHDVANAYTREKLDIKIIKLLEYHKQKPSFLVFNKIDVLKSKRKLLDLTRIITDNCLDGKPIPGLGSKKVHLQADSEGFKGWPYFKEIFMVSALTGDGLSEVKKHLVKNSLPGKWMFPQEVWTDQSIETIITNSVKARLLDFLPQEIPYSLKTQIEFFEINEQGVISTVVLVNCPSSRISKLIAGAADGRLRQITQSIQEDLQEAFHNFVRIQIVLEPPYK